MKKREMRRKLRDWRRKGGEEEKYKRGKQEYRLCKKKKKEENLRWKKKADEVRREGEVWEVVNRERERKKRKRINKSIEWEEWKEHFREIVGSSEE